MTAPRFGGRGRGPWLVGEMEEFSRALIAIAEREHPASVRQMFYLVLSEGLIAKTEKNYGLVGRVLTELREQGRIPDAYIVDYTRSVELVSMWTTPTEFLETAARSYRRDPWQDQEDRVVIVCEKEALLGVFEPVTQHWCVPLVTLRGYPSRSYLANDVIQHIDGRTWVFTFGDYDPSGVNIPQNAYKTLLELRRGEPFEYIRIAINQGQIAEYGLMTRPTKSSDTRSEAFGSDVSVDLEALTSGQLQELVRNAITSRIDLEVWSESLAKEEEQKRLLKQELQRLAANLDE